MTGSHDLGWLLALSLAGGACAPIGLNELRPAREEAASKVFTTFRCGGDQAAPVLPVSLAYAGNPVLFSYTFEGAAHEYPVDVTSEAATMTFTIPVAWDAFDASQLTISVYQPCGQEWCDPQPGTTKPMWSGTSVAARQAMLEEEPDLPLDATADAEAVAEASYCEPVSGAYDTGENDPLCNEDNSNEPCRLPVCNEDYRNEPCNMDDSPPESLCDMYLEQAAEADVLIAAIDIGACPPEPAAE